MHRRLYLASVALAGMASAIGSARNAPIPLQTKEYLQILEEMISHNTHLQNAPSRNLIPEEIRIVRIVERELAPFVGEHLVLRRYDYSKDGSRPNLLIRYQPQGDKKDRKTISIAGSHMDVVPFGDLKSWGDIPPDRMTIRNGYAYGRGTTDCLGHVALLVELIKDLCRHKVQLQHDIQVLLIADEEGGAAHIGAEVIAERGEADFLKRGPVVWLDKADSQPVGGSGTVARWTLEVHGLASHPGYPQNGINAYEVGSYLASELTKAFAQRFPAHPEEKRYHFPAPSTMKALDPHAVAQGLSQIPDHWVLRGDFRVTPFYKWEEVKSFIVNKANELIANLPPMLPGLPYSPTRIGNVTAKAQFSVTDRVLKGVAIDIDSPAFADLTTALTEVKGHKPELHSSTGGLPLVHDLAQQGIKVMLLGFGESATYHNFKEKFKISDMEDGYRVLQRFIELQESH